VNQSQSVRTHSRGRFADQNQFESLGRLSVEVVDRL
jgi:hypothetical protein